MTVTEPQTFHDELARVARGMKIYNMRYHLSMFPRELVRSWWDRHGDLPEPTSMLAYLAYKAGMAPRRRLSKDVCDNVVAFPRHQRMESVA